jgi:hypothetical protein
MPTTTPQAHLGRLLTAMFTGAATAAIEDLFEDAYPCTFDPADGMCYTPEDN